MRCPWPFTVAVDAAVAVAVAVAVTVDAAAAVAVAIAVDAAVVVSVAVTVAVDTAVAVAVAVDAAVPWPSTRPRPWPRPLLSTLVSTSTSTSPHRGRVRCCRGHCVRRVDHTAAASVVRPKQHDPVKYHAIETPTALLQLSTADFHHRCLMFRALQIRQRVLNYNKSPLVCDILSKTLCTAPELKSHTLL
jgi:hypothetical protein